MNYSFLVSLLIFLGVQFALQYFLLSLGLSSFWFNLLYDLILAILLTIYLFRGREKLKNPAFHRTLAIIFAFFTIVSLLFGNYF